MPGGTQPPGCPLNPAGTTGDNGNVIGYTYTDGVNSSLSHTALYVYDSLNRLACAQATGNSTYNQSFAFDAYGNLSCTPSSPGCVNLTHNTATNHIAGYTYDAAGNVTNDGTNTYQWDAEGHLIAVINGAGVAISTNTYNALGQRVRDVNQTNTTDEAYGAGGSLLWRYTGNPNDPNQRAFVPSGGRILAEYYTGGTLFDHPDQLGSITSSTSANGSPCQERLFYPFGELWTGAGNCGMHQTFAQLPDYDPETDQYNTLYRHYTPNGRWMRPDPLAGDVTNPQSLNRYAYVTNNPTSLTDSTGLGLPGCPQGMPDQWCYGGIPGFWAGGAQMFTFSSPTWDEFNSVFPMTFIPGENGDESELLSGSDLNGFLLLGITVLPLQTLSQLALLPHQVQQMQQNACTQPILDAVNDQFGTNFTPDNVQGDPFPNGQATNLSILATGLPAAVFNSIQTGRYPESPLTWVTGYGPTLHVTGQTYFDLAPATFQNNNAGGVTSVLFTAHIDSSFAYNPIGFLIHVIRDLLHIGGPRNPCP